MLFSKNNSVRSFHLSITSGGLNKPVAFGPGSVVNGSVFLTLDKPLFARRLRIVFKCEEQLSSKQVNTLFSVETVVWHAKGNKNNQASFPSSNSILHGEENTPDSVSAGSQMYLFAIKLPNVNYPPSMHDSHFGHHVDYSLQGFLDLESNTIETKKLQVTYLPLIACNVGETSKDKVKQGEVEMVAELIQPAYLPG
ncbi:hypothetical protein DFQ29_009553 [Apophysomyces sp. BC1021]|nr:hypothetical protein DFQ29_009553 [Apophysomyces sp. BC1021]